MQSRPQDGERRPSFRRLLPQVKPDLVLFTLFFAFISLTVRHFGCTLNDSYLDHHSHSSFCFISCDMNLFELVLRLNLAASTNSYSSSLLDNVSLDASQTFGDNDEDENKRPVQHPLFSSRTYIKVRILHTLINIIQSRPKSRWIFYCWKD